LRRGSRDRARNRGRRREKGGGRESRGWSVPDTRVEGERRESIRNGGGGW